MQRSTSKTWSHTLEPGPEKPGPLKILTLKNLEPEKPEPRKTSTQKNLDPEKHESSKVWSKYGWDGKICGFRELCFINKDHAQLDLFFKSSKIAKLNF